MDYTQHLGLRIEGPRQPVRQNSAGLKMNHLKLSFLVNRFGFKANGAWVGNAILCLSVRQNKKVSASGSRSGLRISGLCNLCFVSWWEVVLQCSEMKEKVDKRCWGQALSCNEVVVLLPKAFSRPFFIYLLVRETTCAETCRMWCACFGLCTHWCEHAGAVIKS